LQAKRGCTLFEQASVGKNNRVRTAWLIRQTQAEFRPDTRRLAAGNGYARQHYFSSRRFST
jgi:hypothetical protein